MTREDALVRQVPDSDAAVGRHPFDPGKTAAFRAAARPSFALARSVAAAGLALTALVVTEACAASNVVGYSFDAAGNIVAINRGIPTMVSLSGFTPTAGPIGTPVTITGSGFASTPTGNAVTFNGVMAAVTSTTTTTLTVLVPAGATTGPVVVTVAGNSAASAEEFAVASAGVPTIGGFTPGAGSAGTSVSVVGTNFNPAPGATSVKVNQSAATVSEVTPTQLAFAVPPATGSGKLRVATAAGAAVSAVDFVVPPAGVAATDITASSRLAADGAAQGVGLFAFNKFALILFDGNPGDWRSLQFANFVINPATAAISYKVYKPDNTQLAAGTLTATNLTINLPQLPASGTYAVLLGSGNTQVSMDARLETNRVIPSDGSALAVNGVVGQSKRVLIAAMAGGQAALSIAAIATLPAGVGLAYAIALPNGSTFRNGTAYGQGSTDMLPPFTTTGTHPVVLWPTAFTTQTNYRLALMPGITLPIDGAAQDVAFAVPGAGARVNFAGVAGESLGFGITGAASAAAPAIGSTLSVYKPDGRLLVSAGCYAGGTQCAANLVNLPVTGNYAVIVQPWDGATGSLRAWLSHDVAGTLAIGVPAAVALARPGQNARLTFGGATGASVALQMRRVETAPAGQGLVVQVNRPDGTSHGYMRLTGSGQTLAMPPLPMPGTYSIFVEPDSAAQGAATATMEVLLDPGQTIAVDGPTVVSTIAVSGASARFTFAGTAGQDLGVGISSLALNYASNATVSVYRPDGGTLGTFGCTGTVGLCGGNFARLPADGNYQIIVRPADGAIGSFNVTVSTDWAGTLAPGGASSINLDRPGRNARLTFAGAAGQALRLSWSGVAIAGTNAYASVILYRPDGSALSSISFANGGAGGSNLPALPLTGTYTIFVDPPVGATMNATFTLSPR